ncbi:MAG: diacylglycerol/lipid kinase family protein [Actinomycetota bacterium]
MRILLVTNPSAGSSADLDPATLRARLEAFGGVESFAASSAEELKTEIPEAAQGADLIAVAGGDGSINLVINALEDQLESSTFLLLPGGTGNDLARTLAIPEDVLEAADLAGSGRRRALDVVEAQWDGGSHLFVNASMGGFTVQVNKRIDEDLKKKVGPLAFWIGGVMAAKDLERFTATVNGESIVDCVALGVGNGRTCGGGVEIWPDASPTDGLLDVCALPVCSALDAAKLLKRIRNGDHVELEGVRVFQVPEVKLEADPPIELNLDGELVGLSTPATFRIKGRAHFMIPPSLNL